MIRRFHPSDLAEVKEVFLENVPHYFALAEWDDLLAYLEKYSETYFVFEEAGTILGAGGFHFPEPEIGRLSWDFFRQEAKGKGLGRKLIEHCLAELEKEKAFGRIEVWTSQRAHGFYGKFGFDTVEIRKNFWAEGLDLYLMKREP